MQKSHLKHTKEVWLQKQYLTMLQIQSITVDRWNIKTWKQHIMYSSDNISMCRIITKEFRIVSYECRLYNRRKPQIKMGLNLDFEGKSIFFFHMGSMGRDKCLRQKHSEIWTNVACWSRSQRWWRCPLAWWERRIQRQKQIISINCRSSSWGG